MIDAFWFRAFDADGGEGDAYTPNLPPVIETVEEVAAYLTYCRNDLEGPAVRLHPEIGEVLETLRDERETLLAMAPHIIWPLRFVLPHEPHLRPRWMLRLGLFLYDHLDWHMTLPKSVAVDLPNSKFGAGLKPGFQKGFVYSDGWVDDARLVLLNALGAVTDSAWLRLGVTVAAMILLAWVISVCIERPSMRWVRVCA